MNNAKALQSENHTPDGKFAPGNKASPGRTPIAEGGKPNPASVVRNAIADQALDIIQTVIDKALAGDINAAKLVIERISPSLRSIEHVGLTADTLPRMNVIDGADSQVIDADDADLADDVTVKSDDTDVTP